MTLTPASSHGNATAIDGVTVTGTPSTGQVITATSATAAHWAPGGGSASVVSCVLNASMSGVNAHAVGQYPFAWDSLWDDLWNEDTLVAIPTGLGLSFAFNGTNGTITTTAAGTWAFLLSTGVNPDATWKGSIFGTGILIVQGLGPENSDTGSTGIIAPTVSLPSGTTILFELATQTASVADPFAVDATHLAVSRLA